MLISWIILGITAISILFESKFTRYRIIEVTNNGYVKYRIQETFFYIFWKNMEYSISPYSERLLEYDNLDKAIEMLEKLKHKQKIIIRVIKV